MPAPWVRRSLGEGAKNGHKAITMVTKTLGDNVPADRHVLLPSCGPFGTRCGFRHLVILCADCGESLTTWCYCLPRNA